MKSAELVLSVLGIVGTLSGVYFGYRGAIHSVELQLEHEDRTRYQEQRLDAYSAFLVGATDVVAMGHNARPLTPPQNLRLTKHLNALQVSFNQVQLSAGPAVRQLAAELHTLVVPFARGEHTSPDAIATMQKEYAAKVQDLLRAMRRELGTEPMAVAADAR